MKVIYKNPTKEGIARRIVKKRGAISEEAVLEEYKKLAGLYEVVEDAQATSTPAPISEPAPVGKSKKGKK